jgi:hypothetical protein
VEIAVATQTAPADWWNEPDEVLATVLAVLEKNSREVKKRRGRNR